MKKRFLGRGRDEPSREELERQAAEELRQWTQMTGPPPGLAGPSQGPSQTPVPPAPFSAPPPRPPSAQPPRGLMATPSRGPSATSSQEEEAITEMALTQLAEARGAKGRLEEMVIRADPSSAEAMRDRALQDYLKRKEQLDREREQLQATAPKGGASESAGLPGFLANYGSVTNLSATAGRLARSKGGAASAPKRGSAKAGASKAGATKAPKGGTKNTPAKGAAAPKRPAAQKPAASPRGGAAGTAKPAAGTAKPAAGAVKPAAGAAKRAPGAKSPAGKGTKRGPDAAADPPGTKPRKPRAR